MNGKIHRLICPGHGALFRPLRWARQRPVRHKGFYVMWWSFAPAVVLIAFVVLGSYQLTQALDPLYDSLPSWIAWGPIFVLEMFVRVAAFSIVSIWGRRNAAAVYEFANAPEFDPMEAKDLGEYLEIGPGWRRLRFDFAVTYGSGRCATVSIEFVEFAVNNDTGESRVLASSHPGIEAHVGESIPK